MAPPASDGVKSVLADVNKFVKVTLKGESLGKKAEAERLKLIEALENLFADNNSLAPNSGDDNSSTSSHKCPSVTGSVDDSKYPGDGSLAGSDDYDDNIPSASVKSLENPAKLGYLEYKKEKTLFSKLKKFYFVLHKRVLYCFKNPSDKKQTSAFIITGFEFRECPQLNSKKKDCGFELVCPGKKSHQFLADSNEDLIAWKEVLQAAADLTEDDDDLYEPLPEPEVGLKSSAAPIHIQVDEPTSQAEDKVEEIDEEEDLIYDEGTSEQPNTSPASLTSPAPTQPQLSPGQKTGGKLKNLFQFGKKKASLDSGSPKDKKEEAKVEGKEDVEEEIIAEEGDDIYEAIGQDVPPPPVPESSRPPVPPIPKSTKDDAEPASKSPLLKSAPKSPAHTSATQSATNVPQLPSRPEQPSSNVPQLPPSRPDQSSTNAPQLPSRPQIPPPLPQTPIPNLPPRGPSSDSQAPPLPSREPPYKPPNIPVPPIPTEKKALSPALDKRDAWPAREEDYENLYYSAWPCTGNSDKELSFCRGDLIHIISRDLEPFSWWVGELAGKIGLVPKAFLTPAFAEVS